MRPLPLLDTDTAPPPAPGSLPLTPEQQAIVDHNGDCRVNAVAGSGKTSTLVAYAARRPRKRILYLAFNRSVREEAVRKFARAACPHVTVETAHSLAYRADAVGQRYQVTPNGTYRTHEIAQLCRLPHRPGNAHLALAAHIRRFLVAFCNSHLDTMNDLDYLGTLDAASNAFAQEHEDDIRWYARNLLERMAEGNIPMIHDAYLKLYQLRRPQLPFDTLLFDEGQDASPVMLAVFLRQKATRVIVGDSHQQIYSFRHAINSLSRVGFPRFDLTHSFRFGPVIARTAANALSLKYLLDRYREPAQLHGLGPGPADGTDAVLARTNLSLLAEAIHHAFHLGQTRIHFEGDLSSYTFASEGANIYDILFLSLGQHAKIRSDFIRQFPSTQALRAYADEAADRETQLIVQLVETYGPELFTLLRRLREFHVPRPQADLIFSTVHRAKGQEYDRAALTNDFITGERLRRLLHVERAGKLQEPLDRDGLAEEINLLYVAITRAKHHLTIPFDFL